MLAVWLTQLGRCLQQAFLMFWVTLWPLILGFALSGAVQAFARRDTMQRRLGSRRPAAVLRASGYGMASSSCSYASAAMARSLFMKGADFTASLVFMFASTNLVIELGIVLIALIGWQFAAGEFVGGCIMISLLAALGGLWFRGRLVDQLRSRQPDGAGVTRTDADPPPVQADEPWTTRARTKAGWADAATFMMGDLTMLRKELLIGFTVAGFLTVLVPAHVWHALFIPGHGFWTVLENVIVGPLIAIISFVCSIGNVPLAATLWGGGISFGGVLSFLFADLLTFPLLLVYRRYYGTGVMLRMLVLFWAVMSTAGLLTYYLFELVGLVPTSRSTVVRDTHVSFNATTVLNVIFLALFGVLYWLYRTRTQGGGGVSVAIDPICGLAVPLAEGALFSDRHGNRAYFCSEHCRDAFATAA
jgi:uncharacterized membrane protein YraQ (UPF0718 family)/YHS domain-containing protein